MSSIERTGSARILRGTAGVLEVSVSVDGTPTDPTVATVAVVDEAGNAVTAGAATITGSSSGKVTSSLSPANTALVNNLIATWSLTIAGVVETLTTYHRIVGDWLFTESEARAFDNAALASPATYPDAMLVAARDRIHESFEDVCRVAFGLSYGREVLDGSGGADLLLAANRVTAVRSIKYRTRGATTWTPLTAAELADVLVDRNGHIERETLGPFLYGRRNIAVEYEHGWQPIPEEVKRAAFWLLRDQLAGTDLPRNAISQSSEIGTFSLSVPGLRGSFYGLPQVDEVIKRYSVRLPGVG